MNNLHKGTKISKTKLIFVFLSIIVILLVVDVYSRFSTKYSSLSDKNLSITSQTNREGNRQEELVNRIFKEFEIFRDLPKFEKYESDLLDLEEAKVLYVLTPKLKKRIDSIITKIQKKYKCSSEDPKIKHFLDTAKHLKERGFIFVDSKPQNLEDNVPPNPFDSEPQRFPMKWKDYLEGIEFRLKL